MYEFDLFRTNKELFKYFELFSKYEVYLEVAIPSIINNIEQIDRGYEDIENRLRSLGAKIERIED